MTKSSAGVDADAAGDFGLGTVTATNNTTLASTEQNLLPTTPTLFASSTEDIKVVSTSTEAAKVLDGTSQAIDVFINALIDDGDQDVTGTPCNLIFNGTIELHWINLGDV
jgi:hypothetical protein